MNKRKIKKKLHLNNKGIDGKIANNTTFDFDFNVEKKESNKLNQYYQLYRYIYYHML